MPKKVTAWPDDLKFALPGGLGDLQLTAAAIGHMLKHKQDRFWKSEAGGQLFATFSDQLVSIEQATGPRSQDCRTRFGFAPDRDAERREIRAMHQRGLHYVGDWHTHPERRPVPSHRDESSMLETVDLSSRRIPGFVLIVVGNGEMPACLSVSFVQPGRHTELRIEAPTTGVHGSPGPRGCPSQK